MRLDGRSFFIGAEIVGWDGIETDELIFRDGHFISLDCQEACDFGWTGYEAWEDGETIHFTRPPRAASEGRTRWSGSAMSSGRGGHGGRGLDHAALVLAALPQIRPAGEGPGIVAPEGARRRRFS